MAEPKPAEYHSCCDFGGGIVTGIQVTNHRGHLGVETAFCATVVLTFGSLLRLSHHDFKLWRSNRRASTGGVGLVRGQAHAVLVNPCPGAASSSSAGVGRDLDRDGRCSQCVSAAATSALPAYRRRQGHGQKKQTSGQRQSTVEGFHRINSCKRRGGKRIPVSPEKPLIMGMRARRCQTDCRV